VDLAVIRPSDVEFPLFVHVLGAMLLVGALFAAAVALVLGWRREQAGDVATLTRLGLWTIAVGAVPAWIIMRVGAQWTYSEAGWEDVEDEPAWLGVGFITAEAGGLLILISLILAIVGLRKIPREGTDRSTLGRVVAVLSLVVLAAYLVAVWAMSAKPD
jgi:hypothetical protein